nr:leucine--tRNA ligase [Stackebrandtia endophytica]
MAQQIETRWQDEWEQTGVFNAPNPTGPLANPDSPRADAPKLFVMDMFPYPSGAGLHVGHPLGYVATDSYCRYKRMAGFNVLHPMGYDAFGLPTEQYAIATGEHPAKITENNIAQYRRQLRRLGMAYDTNRTFATSDPDYFKWTQWVFLQIYNAWYDTEADRARPIAELIEEFDSGARIEPGGRNWADLSDVERRAIIDDHRLVYINEAPVNWCPGLGTVLSSEEVTSEGRSERGNFPVFTRTMRQWVMRITSYADRLADDLDLVDWPESTKLMQRNWIGRSTGARIDFGTDQGSIRVFTTRPDTIFGATYMVLAPEHELVDALAPQAWPEGVPAVWTGGHATPVDAIADYRAQAKFKSEVERQADNKEKTGVFTGAYAINPANGARIPVFIADYVLAGYGTGAIMAVPAQDERDWQFATAYDLPIIRTVQPPADFDGDAYTGDGPAINSTAPDGFSVDGMTVDDAKRAMIDWLTEHGHGEGTTTYRLRDWLFSRQRYWGEPFPIVYDEAGMPRPLPESMLPVELPEMDDFSPKTFDPDDADTSPEPPLSRAVDWIEVELDLGDGLKKYRRETNTMPNWAGSSWYELRYIDPYETDRFIDPVNERYWMGPTEAAESGGVDLYIGGQEHAVLHLLYDRFWHKVLFDLGHVSSREPFHKLFHQGMIQAYAFTDSRGAYVPAEQVEEVDGQYIWDGQVVTREYGKMGKSQKNVVTPDEMCERYGADTFRLYEMAMGPLDVSRPWETRAVVGSQRFLQRLWRNVVDENTGEVSVVDAEADVETVRALHRTIDGVRDDMDNLRMNTAIAKLISFNNQVVGLKQVPRSVVEPLVLMTAPFAPHVAEELWRRLGHEHSLANVDFPVADPAHLVVETVTYPVQINGKVRDRIEVAADAATSDVEKAALSVDKVVAALDGRTPRKVIVVPGRMVSIVV